MTIEYVLQIKDSMKSNLAAKDLLSCQSESESCHPHLTSSDSCRNKGRGNQYR